MRAAVLLAAACSGAASAPTPVAVPVLPDVEFALLDREQKMQFMKERVVPTMAPLFRAHDATRYARFDCTTCHADGDFEMPNPQLPRLRDDRSRHDDRTVAWMTTTIRPAMTALLVREIDCTGCHVRDSR